MSTPGRTGSTRLRLAAWTFCTVTITVAPAWAGPHDALTTYEGSKTCSTSTCHPGKAVEVFNSVHYQLKGPTPGVPNLDVAGKLGSINDFCTYPDSNWLFLMTNTAGATVVAGCGSCHVGLGQIPSSVMTQEQLDNIDCLLCHADLYKRKGANVGGRLTFVPDPSVNMATVFTNIHLPTTTTCLTRCHMQAGGGPGKKQGDMDPAQVDPPRSLDVHMASVAAGGAGLSCLNCHIAKNHKIAGRGNDIRETDLSDKVACTNCHDGTPHDSADLNKHTARVNCTVCHIPYAGRNLATEVFRDFSQSELEAASNRYEPVRQSAVNVTPVYRFFNGLSYFYKFGARLDIKRDGTFLLSGPLGSIVDPQAKIHAFKHHQAKMGYDLAGRRLIPANSKVMWETGKADQALQQGAAAVGWPDVGYAFVTSHRYMSLHHMVAPKENALACADCHGGTRMNFKELGYLLKTSYNNRPLCAGCHEAETPTFYRVHRQHVDNEGLSCTTCHIFQGPPTPAAATYIHLLLGN